MGIESIVAELESAGENPILISMRMLNMGTDVLLLKRTGRVTYDGSSFLHGLKGIGFHYDSDWSAYSPQFEGNCGVYFPTACADGVNGFSAAIRIGEDDVISYLKQTGDWDTDGGLRLGCDSRWEKALGAIDLMLDNKVKPLQ